MKKSMQRFKCQMRFYGPLVEQIRNLNTAIVAAQRSQPKRPVLLIRYRNALCKLLEWQHKFNLAKGRMERYEDKVRYYEKRFSK